MHRVVWSTAVVLENEEWTRAINKVNWDEDEIGVRGFVLV